MDRYWWIHRPQPRLDEHLVRLHPPLHQLGRVKRDGVDLVRRRRKRREVDFDDAGERLRIVRHALLDTGEDVVAGALDMV